MPPSKPISSETNTLLHGRAAFSQAAVEMIASARREVTLLSYDLDPRIYNRADMAEACKDFILLSPHSRLRILLRDPGPAARGHRLVDLGRQLSSFVEFRVLGEHQREVQSDYLIIDERQLLERISPVALEARYYPDDPLLARARRKRFTEWWDAGEPATTLNALHLG